ncbi:GNAT family N-acetyltransferase [Edwardsiella anguillarum]|uniref:GNAT family N-acetyltransferase n=1 Tax=Edwardsiella anguillarum TaxID=1821960 RepID=UPI0024B70181|nr:N-acetyltransferase [Edwardsiella anguillarum]WHP80696.1 N-acetyltransferase [Edwardsiella anguillarum]WHQ18196.1 N-acetyltransferase [Edwardsiella anguillarum]WHQ21734.1 N-acetyltransferase [Edwardsiella anguillarum]WHQ25257.1 N-acetyltransferase [Edwardsiella anguillarum]WHQ28782.1 N-acetyltransferase [Edwardsiella anguillarum]
MLIRAEIPVDAPGIDRLLRRCFPGADEAELVSCLREDGLLTLGVVATDDEGGVVGYAAFSPVTVGGEECQWVGLAPLAVDEAYRCQGIAERLVYEGLDTLNEFGYAGVTVLGEPHYYQRFGFVNAAQHALHCRWPGCDALFQVYALAPQALEQARGRIEYAEPFNRF